MKKQSVFNGLMVCLLIVAMLPVSGPLAARAAPEPLQEMKVTETTGVSTTPGEIQQHYQNGLSGLSGVSGAQAITVTAANSGDFSEVSTTLTGVAAGSSVAWGDYDNDGWLDILLTGLRDGSGPSAFTAKVYHNNGNGTFTDIGAGLTRVWHSSVAWGDYDNDGRLNILLTGITKDSAHIAAVYHNNGDGNFIDIGAGLGQLHLN